MLELRVPQVFSVVAYHHGCRPFVEWDRDEILCCHLATTLEGCSSLLDLSVQHGLSQGSWQLFQGPESHLPSIHGPLFLGPGQLTSLSLTVGFPSLSNRLLPFSINLCGNA